MALSDVNVKVNIVARAGIEPVWYPLFVTKGANSSSQPLSKIKGTEYSECTSLQQLVDLLAPYAEEDSRAERREKQELVKSTGLYKAVAQMFRQNDHPNRFAVIVQTNSGDGVGALISKVSAVLDQSWRQLVPAEGFDIQDCYKLAEYIENLEQRKMLFFSSSSVSDAVYEDSSGGKTYALTDYTRTVCVYSPISSENPHAAVIGASAGKTPGSVNYRNLVLKGITPVALTAEELETLHENGFIAAVERAGDVVTSQGKSASGERYLDTLDIEDYIVEQLIYASQKALNVNDTVPYNNDGISILENAAVSVMLDCCSKGMIAHTDTNSYEYSVNYPAVTDVPEEDIKNRTYNLGSVSFTVQGAIDREEITVDMML